MRKQKKGFTMLEIILVIAIVSVIMFTFRNMFVSNKRDLFYAESCINKIYGDINNYLYAAMTSKGLYNGTETIYPEKYIIKFRRGWGSTQDIGFGKDQNVIEFRYKKDNTDYIFKKDYFSSEELKNYYCSTSKYTIFINNMGVKQFIINKKSQKDSQNIYLEGSDSFIYQTEENTPLYGFLFTGEIPLKFCYKDSTAPCKEIASFFIDTRTQSVKKKLCIVTDETTGICTKRDQ